MSRTALVVLIEIPKSCQTEVRHSLAYESARMAALRNLYWY